MCYCFSCLFVVSVYACLFSCVVDSELLYVYVVWLLLICVSLSARSVEPSGQPQWALAASLCAAF